MQVFGHRTSEGEFVVYFIIELDQNDINVLPRMWEVPEHLYDVIEARSNGISLKNRDVRVIGINFDLNHPQILWEDFDPTFEPAFESEDATDETHNIPFFVRVFFPKFAQQVAKVLQHVRVLQEVVAKLRK